MPDNIIWTEADKFLSIFTFLYSDEILRWNIVLRVILIDGECIQTWSQAIKKKNFSFA